MPVSPAFMQAVESGAQLGARLRQQQAQEQQAANALRLSFAEQALRQQAHQQAAQLAAQRQQDQMDYQTASLALKQNSSIEGNDIRALMEEGRNTRAADSLTAQGQRNQDNLALRKELGLAGNEVKREAETGKNTRAQAWQELRASLGLMTELGKDIRAEDQEEWQREKLDKELAARTQRVGSSLPYADKERMRSALGIVRDQYKDDPLQRIRAEANILNSYLPRTDSMQQAPQGRKKLVLNAKGLFQSTDDGQLAPFQ